MIRAVTILTSLFVVIVNNALRFVVRKFSLSEKHSTLTAYNISVAFKLTMARFINTSIIPIVVNYKYEQYFNNGGLIPDVFYLILAISFVDPIMYWVDIPYQVRRIKRSMARGNGENSTLTQ